MLQSLVLALSTALSPQGLRATPCVAARVQAKDGNIVLIRRDSAPVQVTRTGQDADPSLSCDGTFLTFVRDTRVPNPDGAMPDDTQQELRLLSLSTHQEIILARRGTPAQGAYGGKLSGVFERPMFSLDGQFIFVQEPHVSSEALYRVALLAPHMVQYVAGNWGYVILHCDTACDLDGYVLVAARRYQDQRGSAELIIVNPTTLAVKSTGVWGEAVTDACTFLHQHHVQCPP